MNGGDLKWNSHTEPPPMPPEGQNSDAVDPGNVPGALIRDLFMHPAGTAGFLGDVSLAARRRRSRNHPPLGDMRSVMAPQDGGIRRTRRSHGRGLDGSFRV
jgi:hypothetical protein